MVKGKRRGPLAKAIRKLCSRTLLAPTNEPQFKEGLRKIINEWGSAFFYHIGLAIQAWIVGYAPERKDEIWQLVDDVEPLIRQNLKSRLTDM